MTLSMSPKRRLAGSTVTASLPVSPAFLIALIASAIGFCFVILLHLLVHLLKAHGGSPFAEALTAEVNVVSAHKSLLTSAKLALVCTAAILFLLDFAVVFCCHVTPPQCR